jgi:hypothetical protein
MAWRQVSVGKRNIIPEGTTPRFQVPDSALVEACLRGSMMRWQTAARSCGDGTRAIRLAQIRLSVETGCTFMGRGAEPWQLSM